MSLVSNYCSWRLFVNGVEVNNEHRKCIESLAIDDLVYSAAGLTIDFKDPEIKFVDDNILIEKAPIHFEMNYTGTNHTVVFNGEIIAVDMSFEEDLVTLTVYCLDEAFPLNREAKKKTWKKKRNIDVAQEIAQSYGLKFVTESNYPYFFEIETITQSDMTDLAFCENLAGSEFDKFYCKIRNGTMYYLRYTVGENPKSTFNYRSEEMSIKAFRPQHTTESVRRESIEDIDINSKKNSDIKLDTNNGGADTKSSAQPDNPKDPNANKSGYLYNTKTGKWELVKK